MKMLIFDILSSQRLKSEISAVRVVLDKWVTQQRGQKQIVVEICDDEDIPSDRDSTRGIADVSV